MRRLRVFALCLCAMTVLLAQTDRGVVTGTVKDSSGAVVPGAQVSAVQTGTNERFRTTTTSAGDFTVPSLPAGTYRVRVENTGFKTYVGDNVVVAPGSTVSLNVTLEVGTSQQTIEVAANAQMLQAESARVGTEVSNRMVDDLPILVNGAVRSPFDLSATTPEVNTGSGTYRVGGGKIGAYGMTLDGTTVTTAGQLDGNGVSWTQINTPSLDALTEFSVTSGGFKADVGHASGGAMSFVSKSGTNELHGDAYDFLRNQDLDAKGFFGATKPIYKQNDFGVTIGGPVWIPKVYHGKDKSFFFSYEGFRNRVGATVTPYSVPTPEMYSGNFQYFVNGSNALYQIYDPSTTALVNGSYQRTPFPNNQIPVSRIDAVSKAIINYVQPILAPNVPGTVPGTSGYVRNNYVSAGTSISPNNKYSVRGDQVLTSKQRLSFFFERTREKDLFGPTGAPGLPEPLAGNPGFNQSDVYRISYDFTLKPTLLNRFYAGGNNWEQNHGSFATYSGAPLANGLPTTSTNWQSKGICIPNYPACQDDFPQVNFANSEFTSWGVPAPNGSDNIVVEFHDDMTWSKGSHTMKWGYFYNTTHYNGFGEQNIAGSVNFQDLNTGIPLNTNQNVAGGGAFASFLLGQVSGYSLDTPRYLATIFRSHDVYFQDDWRVNHRFTLNYGVRWSMSRPVLVGNYEASDFSPTLPNPGAGGLPGALIFDGFGAGRINKDSLTSGWNGWGPRLGLAYSINDKTTIRAGASRSFGPLTYEGSSSHNLGIVQRLSASDQSTGLNPLWVLQNGAPAYAQTPDIDPSVGNGANVPYYNGKAASTPSDEINYSINIERALTNNMMLEVGYLATNAAKIQSNLLYYNQLNLATLPAALNPFTSSGRTLLSSQVTSASAIAAGITPPWAGFTTLWGTGSSVEQSVRPFPQYGSVDTVNGQGDKIGHSTYNALQVKFTKRYSSGLTIGAFYVLSKMLTDADNSNGGTENQANRSLEKSIASFDQTHVVKINYVYELPFGHGKHFLSKPSVARAILGDWRFGGTQQYVSGTPVGLGTTVSIPIANGGNRPTITTYDGWGGTYTGKFDPGADTFFQPASFFGTQPTTSLGNSTRYNPKMRYFPSFNESASLNRAIRITESKHLDLRWESFNYLNRTQFGSLSGGTSLQNANFGLWRSQSNSARRMQVSMKFYW